jgi:flagella basal body P-ring formation protein FlgA
MKRAVVHLCFPLALAISACSDPAYADFQDVHEIEVAALGFARQHTAHLPGRVEVTADGLDTSLQLIRCTALHTFLPANARLWGRSLVGVRCAQPASWSVQVPVTVQVRAQIVMTARPVGRNQVLSAADLTRREMDHTRLPLGVLLEVQEAVGRRTLTALPAGSPLRPDMIKSPLAVMQGQIVQLVYKGEGFRVNGEGRSLSDAAVGEQAQVRTQGGKLVRGVVIDKGVVQVQ